MHGVDQVGVEKLPDGGNPTAEPDVLALRRLPRLLKDRSRVAVDEVNVESESVNEGRMWWVRTNTGVRNGGSSPHQPCHS
jgi:hypothetical protein